MGMIIFVFLVGMVFGMAQPTFLYAGAEAEDLWEQFVDPKPYPGKSLTGPLSIYYDIDTGSMCMDGSSYTATMYYTVRLSMKKELYTFQGSKEEICLADIAAQGNEIKSFLGNVVVQGIFPSYKSWKLKSINNGTYHYDDVSMAFVADIEIVVDKK
jgi:hypothetical protein